MIMDNNILTVSGLNLYVRMLIESDRNLKSLWLQGEISNLTVHSRSGHIYMTLKDDKASIKAVMFAGSAKLLKFRPKEGMKVLVRGRVSLYDAAGTYQLYIDDMQPFGVGALNLAFEQLKNKLLREGLFDEAHKKPLPAYPSKIGVITSPTGAALQDILRILKRRYPAAEVVLYPVLVQGDGASAQLTRAVRYFDKNKCADVVIIGRGGGSAEDLWAFNDEGLARAVYECSVPIVSAVGHETDFTICDFAADVRASTPSAGAELVSPEMSAMISEIEAYRSRLSRLMRTRIEHEKLRLDRLSSAGVMRSPVELVRFRRMKLDMLRDRLTAIGNTRISEEKARLAQLGAELDAMSPLKVLARGYVIAEKDHKTLRSAADVHENDRISIIMQDGQLDCAVLSRREKDNV